MAEATTKVCDYCDQEIGISETKCPKCGIEFEEAEATVSAVSSALTVIEKRKAREKAKKEKELADEIAKNPPTKKSVFSGLARRKG